MTTAHAPSKAAAGPHIIHIGLHKTGSTWLQRFVFPALPGLSYNPQHPLTVALAENLASATDREFLEASFRALVDQYERRRMRLLISSEGLSGQLWGERYASRTAHRLAHLIPSARVLMVVRNQADMIRAIYAQYVHEGGYSSLSRFLEGELGNVRFDFDSLHYDRLASLYIDLFGHANVWIVPHEYLLAQRDIFLDELCRFFETERPASVPTRRVNSSLSPAPMLAMRAWNHAFRTSRFNAAPSIAALGHGTRVRRLLQNTADPLLRRVIPPNPERQRRRLSEWGVDRYAESNRRLSEISGFPLADLGYQVTCG